MAKMFLVTPTPYQDGLSRDKLVINCSRTGTGGVSDKVNFQSVCNNCCAKTSNGRLKKHRNGNKLDKWYSMVENHRSVCLCWKMLLILILSTRP